MNAASFLGNGPRRRDNVVLMVFSVGQDHDHARGLALAVEAIPACFHRPSDGRPLGGHHARSDGFQKQTQCVQVCGERALNVGFTCKHDEPQAIARGVGRQPFDGPFGQVQAGTHVLCHHAVADVQRHHHVNPFGFHFLQSASHFGIEPSHKQRPDGQAKKQVFPRW